MAFHTKKSTWDDVDHKCTLPVEEDIMVRYISGGYCVTLRRWLKRQTMVCETNARSKMYLKSTYNIRRDRLVHLEEHYNMIHPFSSMKCYWEFFMIIVIILVLIIVPVLLCMENVSQGMLNFRCVLDIFCLTDMIIIFKTGYLDERTKRVILSQKQVTFQYLKSRFFPDLLCFVNMDFAAVFMNPTEFDEGSFMRFLNIMKILRMFTLVVYLDRSREYFQFSIFRFKMFKLLLIMLLLIVWATGILYIMDIEFRRERYSNEDDGMNLMRCFVEVFDFFFLLDHYPSRSVGLLPFEMFALAAGVVLQMFFLSQILQMVEKYKTSENKYNDKNIQLHNYVRNKQVPKRTAKKCQDYFDFKFQKSYYRETEILQTLSSTLRDEINSHICEKLLENVDILKDMPFSVIRMLTSLMEEEIYLPNDIIIRAGDTGDCMYFISSGMVAVYTPGGKEICHISNGGNFGEVSMMMEHKSRVATVVAVDYCDLYVLTRKNFLIAIEHQPDLYQKSLEISKKRMAEVVMNEHFRNVPEEFHDMRTPEGVCYFKKSLYEL